MHFFLSYYVVQNQMGMHDACELHKTNAAEESTIVGFVMSPLSKRWSLYPDMEDPIFYLHTSIQVLFEFEDQNNDEL